MSAVLPANLNGSYAVIRPDQRETARDPLLSATENASGHSLGSRPVELERSGQGRRIEHEAAPVATLHREVRPPVGACEMAAPRQQATSSLGAQC